MYTFLKLNDSYVVTIHGWHAFLCILQNFDSRKNKVLWKTSDEVCYNKDCCIKTYLFEVYRLFMD